MRKEKFDLVFYVGALLLLVMMPNIALNIPPVSASETIYIRADGSVDPATSPIYTLDNITYTFTDNINDSIVVERDSILVDGASHVVQGTGLGRGIDLSRRSNVTIKNMVIRSFEAGVYCFRTLNSSIVESNITGNSYGIRFFYSANCNISMNNITKNSPGIYLYRSTSNIISRNSIVSNNDYGIYLYYYSLSNNIFGNNITGNNIGVFLYSSSSNIISGSYITKSNYTGVWLYTSSNHNIVSGNNITNNDSGLYSDYSSNNTISRNNITGNIDSGIYLYSSSNNSLYSNNFVDNLNHVNTTDSANIWDNGYPTCGNYWDNYTGVDFYSGPYQNETGSDGIGDSPYVIDTNNSDHFPLMHPWVAVSPVADFSYSPEFPWVGKTVIFNALASSNPNTFIADYKWDFGDGNNVNMTTPIIGHVYTAQGTYEVSLTVTNTFGINHTVTKSIEVIIDNIPPTTLDNYDGLWHNADFTVDLTATDSIPGSGVQETYYKINNGPEQNLSIRGEPLITTERANNTLEYWSLDKAGNEESHHILTGIKLDKTAPSGSITISNNAIYANSNSVTLTLTATDATSGAAQMRFHYDDNATWSDWEPYATSKLWALSTGDGTKTIYVQFMDKAGLTSPTYQDTITLDTTKPIADAGIDQTVNEGMQVTFNASASTDQNGIASYTWAFTDVTPKTLTGKNPTYTFTAQGTYTVTLTVADPAGNSATDTVVITVTPVESFPWWIVGAAIAVIGIAASLALWRKRKSQPIKLTSSKTDN